MADNFTGNPGSGGQTFGSDEISGVHFPRSKLIIGEDGVNDGDVSLTNPLPVEQVQVGTLGIPVQEFLKNGGNVEANGDYSGGAVDFTYAPGAGEQVRIHSGVITIYDSAVGDPTKYGFLAALTNGIQIYVKNGGGVVQQLMGGEDIKTLYHWERLGCGVNIGSSGKVWVGVFEFHEKIRLDGDDGEYLAVTVNDDLTGLDGHTFYVAGHREDSRR